MSDAALKTTRDRALDVVRGYTDHDAVAVRDALASNNAGGWTEVYADFAVAEASRAWARGDRSALRGLSVRDLPGAVHITAVFVVVLGLALWGRTGLLDVLKE
ncbi:hypothetical protein [Streptomyces tailanensis]|uniref:hypothetical protein n=1 Tax=Streptomyces tailanensis TaxID=2569858 RepID=UPI00122E7ACF|nr:hypothetical protein [Streptomyces tailanensis]